MILAIVQLIEQHADLFNQDLRTRMITWARTDGTAASDREAASQVEKWIEDDDELRYQVYVSTASASGSVRLAGPDGALPPETAGVELRPKLTNAILTSFAGESQQNLEGSESVDTIEKNDTTDQ